MEDNLLLLFIVASGVMLMTPGPSSLFIVSKTLNEGKTTGLVSVIGITAGLIIHVLLVSFGISKLILLSPVIYACIQILGVGFILYLGIKLLFARTNDDLEIRGKKGKNLFFQGFLLNALNPKNLIFFFSLMPQFIVAHSGNYTQQSTILSAVFLLMAFCWGIVLVYISGYFTKYMSTKVWKLINVFSGMVFIFFGLYMVKEMFG